LITYNLSAQIFFTLYLSLGSYTNSPNRWLFLRWSDYNVCDIALSLWD